MFAKNTGVLTQFRPPNGPNSHTCSPQPALHPSSTSIHIRKVCHPPQPHRPTGLDALPLARLHHPPARRAALAALQDGHQGGCLQGAALQASLPGQRSAARTSSVCLARDVQSDAGLTRMRLLGFHSSVGGSTHRSEVPLIGRISSSAIEEVTRSALDLGARQALHEALGTALQIRRREVYRAAVLGVQERLSHDLIQDPTEAGSQRHAVVRLT